ncbi:putative DNA-binding protein, partial [uncultured Caudovirales phage]
MNDLTVTGNTLTMSSREIADLTGKQHKHVIRDVRAMLEELSVDGPVLGHVEVKDARGYTDCFNLNRELTETLITGYSIALRHKVIRRLHELEAGTAPVLPQSLPEALRMAADAIDERNRLQAVVTEQQPKIEALDRIAGATGAMCITDAAKHLQIKPHALFAWLQEHKWIFRRPGCRHWLAYQERIQSGHLLHKVPTVGTDEQGEQRAA